MVKFHEFLALAVVLMLGAFILFNAFAPNVYKKGNAGAYAQPSGTQYYGGAAQQQAAGSPQAGGAAGEQAGSAQGAAGGNIAAGGTQTIQMKVNAGYYEPRYITVNQGTKVRLELDPNTFRGCMVNFNIWGLGIKKRVTAGDNVVEFDATTPGTYKMSCNMGMGDGTFTIKPSDGSNAQAVNDAAAPPSYAGGCGGSGGCGCGGGAAAQPAPSGSCGGSGGSGGCGCGG